MEEQSEGRLEGWGEGRAEGRGEGRAEGRSVRAELRVGWRRGVAGRGEGSRAKDASAGPGWGAIKWRG